MWKVWFLEACLCVHSIFCLQFPFEDIVRKCLPDTSAEVQKTAAEDVIMRLIPKHAHLFEIEVDKSMPLRSFQLQQSRTTGNIRILASDGISATKGFHHYLKYNLHSDVSWSGNQLEHIPSELPAPNPNGSNISQSQSAFIYYQNVCTWSYSFAWWSWIDWRRHIDWMALMGISLTIAPIQEQIWTDIYKDYGLTDDEIYEHFAGPAFLAWQRMGNIRGWAGPLTPTYRRMQLLLQKEIIKAQRNLGITVALPSFAGHLPKAFARIFSNTTFDQVERWNRFPDNLCCPLFADPNKSLFREIGQRFLRAIINVYGSTDHIYFSDPFNEIQPAKAEVAYLKQTATNIYAAMSGVDASAVWLLQGWMFVKNPFWSDALMEAFLTAIPRGRLLVLDLQSEQFPQYERTNSYHGQPFIWCMLHNFGGTLGMHGSAGIVNTRIRLARNMDNSTMLGVGITPEGIDQNYVMYSLALERAWMEADFDLDQWFREFARVRYGSNLENLQIAWQYLRKSVYSYRGLLKIRGKYVVVRRPATNLTPWVWYNTTWVQLAFEQMLRVDLSSSSSLWRHDLVDITRQFLQQIGDRTYVNLMDAYREGNSSRFRWLSTCMIDILYDMDKVLATHEKFLLGRWLSSAKRMAWNPLEKILLEINARNQITTWGPNARILDYATKQWAGMMVDFHLPRWKLFLDTMQRALDEGGRFGETAFRRKVFKDIESPFGVDRKVYTTKAVGDSFGVAQMIHDKWKVVLQHENLRSRIPWQHGMSDGELELDEDVTTSSFPSEPPEVVAV